MTVLCVSASDARAAEVTRVASSAEKDHPFGMHIDVAYDRTQTRGKIVREWYQKDSAGADTIVDVAELRYTNVKTKLALDLHVGLYHDLEFHFGLPIVFQDDSDWTFAGGTNAGNSTLFTNCIAPNGDTLPATGGCPSLGHGTGSLLLPDDRAALSSGGAPTSYRGGLGDVQFGLAWAILNNRKDDTKPTWTVALDYHAPTAQPMNFKPAGSTTYTFGPDARGKIGEGVHRYVFSTALSKRLGPADPYFQVKYTLPYKGPSFISNCDVADPARMGSPQNCGKLGWERDETGIRVPHVLSFLAGTELIPYEYQGGKSKIAFDFRVFMNWNSEGRTFNEMSDLLGKLLMSSDYATVGGQIGFFGYATEFASLKLLVSFAHNTEHFLTNEGIGKDLNGDGVIQITDAPQEVNPNLDWRVDRVGRRFRIAETTIFKVNVVATFSF